MSTRLVCHAFGVRGREDVRTGPQGGQTPATIRQQGNALRCPVGGPTEVRTEGRVERRSRSLPIGSRVTVVAPPTPRVSWGACRVARRVEAPFADPGRASTEASRRYARGRPRRRTALDVARRPGVSRDVVKGIQKRDPSRRHARPKGKDLRRVAIAGTAVGEGRRSPTVALGLKGGAAASVGGGNGGGASKPSRKRLRRCEAKVEAAAMGMPAAYRGAVSTPSKGATIVFDHSHVIEPFNDDPSDLRRPLYHQADEAQETARKGGRRRPLKAPEDLDDGEGESARSGEASRSNEPVAPASSLEEDLRRFRSPPGKTFAGASLTDRVRRAEASGVRRLRQRAGAPEGHRAGLLAYHADPISTGPREGPDDKIETGKRQG